MKSRRRKPTVGAADRSPSRPGRNRIVGFSIGKHVGVMSEIRRKGTRTNRINGDRISRRIVGVCLHQLRQATGQLPLLLFAKLLEVRSEVCVRLEIGV